MAQLLPTRQLDRLADGPVRRRTPIVFAVLLVGGLGWIAAAGRAEPPRAAAEPRRDLYGDPLPPGALARMGTIRWRHRDGIGGFIEVVPAPVGQLVATNSRGEQPDPVVRVWDLSDGRPVSEVPLGDTIAGRGIQFTPDGARLMVLGPRGVVKFYNPRTGKFVAESKPAVAVDRLHGSGKGERYSSTTHSLTADGRWVATDNGGGDLLLTEIVTDPAAAPHQVKLEPPPKDTGRNHTTFTGFASDGTTIVNETLDKANGWKPQVLRWDVRTGRLIATPTLDTRNYVVAFSPDGRKAATWRYDGAANDRLRVWDTTTGKELVALEGAKQTGHGSIRFSPDGKCLVGEINRSETGCTVAVWELDRGKIVGRVTVAPWGNEYWLLGDGKTLVAADSVGMMFGTWDLVTGRRLSPPAGHESKLRHVAFGPDGKTLLTISMDPGEPITTWDAATGKKLRQLTPPRKPGPHAYAHWTAAPLFVLTPGGAVVTTDNGTLIWADAQTGRELRRVPTKRFSPKDEFTVQEERVSLVTDPRTGKAAVVGVTTYGHSPYTLQEPENGWRDVLTVWDAETGAPLGHRVYPRPYPDPPGRVSPDGRLLVRQYYDYPNGKVIEIDSALTGRGGFKLWPPDDLSPHGLFTPDGQTLVTLTTHRPPENPAGPAEGVTTVRLWEVRTGRERFAFVLPFTVPAVGKAARFEPLTLAASPDGRFLAAAWSDNAIRVWDLATGAEVATRSGYGTLVDTLMFRPDGKAVASGHSDGTALVWDLSELPGIKPVVAEREAAWADLASADAAKAYRAIHALAADPGCAGFLRDRVKPAVAIPAARLRALVNDLDSDRYATREAATAALQKLGDTADAELTAILAGDVSAEQHRRLTDVLAGRELTESDPERLRALRCVEVLERAGTAEAAALLAELAKGAPGARLTRDAAGAVRRRAQGR
jgi:WD40 repeat protein